MTYQVRVKPLQFRQRDIQNLKSESASKFSSYDVYPPREETLTVIRLPIDVPIYRMQNGRTQTAQYAYARERGKDISFFASGEENEDAQNGQHSILIEISSKKLGQIASITEELKQNGQKEPLLITPTGVVVNGNRRLSAMRELYAKGDQRFSVVDCAVLPGLNSVQLDELEMRLQMASETKLPYSWVSEALKIESLMAEMEKEDEPDPIARVRRVVNKQTHTVLRSLAAISLAKEYLSVWKLRPDSYDLVEKGKQFFEDLPGVLDDMSTTDREIAKNLAFALYDAPRTSGRVYGLKDVIQDHLASLRTKTIKFAKESYEDVDGFIKPPRKPDPLQPIVWDLYEESAVDEENRLIQGLSDDEDGRAILRNVITPAIDSIRNTQIDIQDGQKALRLVRQSRETLRDIDLSKADKATFVPIREVLNDIESVARKMRREL